jgi:hypothetical protein
VVHSSAVVPRTPCGAAGQDLQALARVTFACAIPTRPTAVLCGVDSRGGGGGISAG